MKKDVVAILLGRKGSKGLPGKNTSIILGRPISHYSLMAAEHSKFVSTTYLSTDDEEIIRASSRFEVELIERPKSLCTDEALFEDALLHAYKEILERRKGAKPEFVVVLMCNVITVTSELIDMGINALIENPDADSAVTVSRLNMYSPLRARKLNEKGFLLPFVPFETFGDPNKLSCDRDSQGDVFFADMSHSVCRAESLENMADGLLPQRWMGQNIIPVLNSFGCDIDEEWQVGASLSWLKSQGFSKMKTPYD